MRFFVCIPLVGMRFFCCISLIAAGVNFERAAELINDSNRVLDSVGQVALVFTLVSVLFSFFVMCLKE